MNEFGVDAEPATDRVDAHVFVVLDEWIENGPQVQSRALTITEVDTLIDRLIDAQRQARVLLAQYGHDARVAS
jgi:hypothetical protein